MASHQTIVVELGSSRIKVGFAGESKPRRVLNDNGRFDGGDGGGGVSDGWSLGVNDNMTSGACNWASFFRYLSSPSSSSNAATATAADGPARAVATVYEWEKTLYPLFSHVLTSILYIQRPARHRMLLLVNDEFPPRNFREALHRVLLEYLGVGGVWLVNGGVFESVYYLMEGLPSSSPLPSSGRPKARLVVDIGTHEARVVVYVAGSSTLADTNQATMAGYHSFVRQVLTNYKEMNENSDESGQSKTVTTLDDANAVVQAWVALSSSSLDDGTLDSPTISVNLSSYEYQPSQSSAQTTVQIPVQPLLRAFHQVYLDYANPSSLIFAILTSAMACPIDFRKVALQNILLLGGGSVALRHFGSSGSLDSKEKSATGLIQQLETAAMEACVSSQDESMEEGKEEEKKEDGSLAVSSISRHRFKSLGGAVAGHVNNDGGRIGGINIQYPDPFAADMAAWVGGSIMGTLGHKQYQKKM
mmetsp:Transcript_12891/g.23160  ORF Transcript_12891/g.23160 Transcript_12891/m.23160 type:complete len:474 (+) Transcript_12891:103-1524(+)